MFSSLSTINFLLLPFLRCYIEAYRQPLSTRPPSSSHLHVELSSSGGRAASSLEKFDNMLLTDINTPIQKDEARLTIVQITDVYTLQYFPHLKTLIKEKRKKVEREGGKLITVLTGDFLAPCLLSSIDKGQGMMNAIKDTPVDYLIWGNHEADIDHRVVCRHVREYPGIWLNTNMQDHKEMTHQKDYDIVEINSLDGEHERRVGLVGVLSDDPALYAQFKNPGAFGGAQIKDPWETLKEYKHKLEVEERCDVVVPFEHLYVPDDYITCEKFDFPVILSGHDHHKIDEVHSGTRLVKPGLDGIYAAVVELSWKNKDSSSVPIVTAAFEKVDTYSPCPELQEICTRAYDVLLPLRNSELARVPKHYEPLSSQGSRERVCTMGKLICSLLKSSLNAQRRQRNNNVDAVILMGGNIRGGTEYEVGSYFSLEALDAEIKADETIGIVDIPGSLLAAGIEATHAGEPIPGWMQYDEGIRESRTDDGALIITHINGKPLNTDTIYRVATKISDLTNGQSAPLTEYFLSHRDKLPPKGAYVNIHAELMGFFARNLWRKIWDNISNELDSDSCEVDGTGNCDAEGRLSVLDRDNSGEVTTEELHEALKSIVGLSVDENNRELATFVHQFADTTGDGKVTVRDMQIFCEEMPKVYEDNKWRLASDHPGLSLEATIVPP